MSAVDYKISDYESFCKRDVIEGFTMLVSFEDRAKKIEAQYNKEK